MKITYSLLFLIIIFSNQQIILAELNYKNQCLEDLVFIKKQIKENSSSFTNKEDKKFHNWFEEGYKHTEELIADINDKSDCYYALKFYLNGFSNPHINLRGNIKTAEEQYPGFLSAKYGNQHIVIYKNSNISYLKNVNVGDKVTHINNIEINKYFAEYILPFYANETSEFMMKAASIYNFIIDGNPYIPPPLQATFANKEANITIPLKYTKFSNEAVLAARNIRQPNPESIFNLKMVADIVWIKIPSFYLNIGETVFYTGMLTKLKELAKNEEYILFDLRGNKGGAAKWSRPIIRNLWGDKYLKSLGKQHDYNHDWIKNVRVSKKNFIEFKKTATLPEIKKFATSLKNNDMFFEKKWQIYQENLNLHLNKDNTPIRAKIYVLTDHFCRSTCSAFVSEITQIPGVTHIGVPTAIITSNSYARKEKTPSEDFDFFYPTEIRIYPQRNFEKPLIPSEIFNGDMQDETAVKNWILSIIHNKDSE